MALDASYRPLTYRRAGGDELVVASGGKLIIESGGTLEAESGATMTLPDIALQAADIGLAIGSIIVGTTGAKGVALDAKTDKQILIGNGTTITSAAVSGDITIGNTGIVAIGAKKVVNTMIAAAAGTVLVGTKTSGDVTALSNATAGSVVIGQGAGETCAAYVLTGDVTMTSGGVTAIGTGKVTAAMLANNAAGLNSVGMGASASYAKTTNGVQTLATGTAGAKTCLFVVSVTETFVTNGGGNEQPTFKFGEVGTDDKFAVAALFTDATAGQIKVFPGSLTASTNVIVTATAANGTGAGAIAVSVIILPTAS